MFSLYSELQTCGQFPLEGNNKGRKTNTHTTTSDSAIFMYIQWIWNSTSWQGRELKNFKITDSMTKYKIKANNATYTFNEDIHKSPNQSFRGLLDSWKVDLAFGVSEKWFQMWKPNTLTLSSPDVKWWNVKV